jgi:hypothetical protein
MSPKKALEIQGQQMSAPKPIIGVPSGGMTQEIVVSYQFPSFQRPPLRSKFIIRAPAYRYREMNKTPWSPKPIGQSYQTAQHLTPKNDPTNLSDP